MAKYVYFEIENDRLTLQPYVVEANSEEIAVGKLIAAGVLHGSMSARDHLTRLTKGTWLLGERWLVRGVEVE